jgi:protein-disulfide isomerase
VATEEIEVQSTEIPPAEAEQKPPEALSPLITIRRTTFNYAFIAIAFLIVGVAIGWFSAFRMDRANRAWVSEAVATAVAEQASTLAGAVAAQRAPSLEDPSSRFTVEAASPHFLGNAEAVVEIIEFGDFNCGYCGRFHEETLQEILDTYEGHVRFVYRDYPILAQTSLTAAIAARCAGDQGEYWAYHDLLYNNQGSFSTAGAFESFASDLGLDVEVFNTCVENQTYVDAVVADYREAQSLGIRGTPAFFINGRPVSGAQPFQVFAGIIAEELEANGVEMNGLNPVS